MSANPHANGGLLRHPLRLPDFRAAAVDVESPGTSTHEATRVLGHYLVDVIRENPDNFRIFGPDETASNRLHAVYEVTDKVFAGEILDVDEHLARSGRVVEILSEHTCQGWLEGYLLTGRHGLFSCYEAFIHLVDSMVNQHAKWLKTTRAIGWRPPIASLNYLLTSHVWRQDHNGFSHQDPGFIDHVVNKSAEVVRVYLPPDTNTLLSTMRHCLESTHYVNVVVAGKQPTFDWLDAESADLHCARGLGIWDWASTTEGEPDVVIACAGDVPTIEALAATSILRTHLPDLAVRFVNVVDLMRLQDETEHPHGLSTRDFDTVFTTDKPVVFAYHGYPWLIHRLTYRRTNHEHIHVRGYKEEGTTTTPFDMVMMNDLDRYHLVMDVIDRVPGLGQRAAGLRQQMVDTRRRARAWTREHGEDLPEVTEWAWSAEADPGRTSSPSTTAQADTGGDQAGVMEIVLEGVRELRFTDGAPVRAASGVARFGDGFLVAQDDATHAAWFSDGPATPVRLLPPSEGRDTFDEASGTKHLKPDLEAACEVTTHDASRCVVPRLGLVARTDAVVAPAQRGARYEAPGGGRVCAVRRGRGGARRARRSAQHGRRLRPGRDLAMVPPGNALGRMADRERGPAPGRGAGHRVGPRTARGRAGEELHDL